MHAREKLWMRVIPNSQTHLPQLRLFCFPYAGGGASIFRTWPVGLPEGVQVCAVQLPGREERLSEEPFDRWRGLVKVLVDVLSPRLGELPFIFFGHSMGALISFELARELRRRGSPQPARLYASGWRAPHLPDPDPPVHRLPDVEFLEELRRLEGTPETVLEDAEMMDLLLPTIRADFAIVETYLYAPEPPLDYPIVAIGGTEDKEVSREELEAWREHTAQDFSLWRFSGGHFFIHQARSQLLARLREDLSKCLL
jgi:surfactin synthase thioesterase subunit